MARAIDADVAIKRFIGWLEGPHKATVYDSGFDDAIWRVLDVIEHMPTLTQPNELSCEGCMYEHDFPSSVYCQGCARMETDNYTPAKGAPKDGLDS